MLRQQRRLFTAASNDDVARLIDEMEREIGAGPCVGAVLDDAPQIDADLMLRRTSQEMNIKIANVAAEIVNHHRGASARGQDPSAGKDPAAWPA